MNDQAKYLTPQEKLKDLSQSLDPGICQAAIQTMKRMHMFEAYESTDLRIPFSALYLCFAHMASGYSGLKLSVEVLKPLVLTYFKKPNEESALALTKEIVEFWGIKPDKISELEKPYVVEMPSPCSLLDEQLGSDSVTLTKSLKELLKNAANLLQNPDSNTQVSYAYPAFVRWGNWLTSPKIALHIISILGHLRDLHSKAKDAYNASTELDSKLHERQKDAVIHAMENRLSIITGGPGTGKTRVIREIISVVLQKSPDLKEKTNTKIILAAPTGKAAYRMGEAIGEDPRLNEYDFSPMTLHRLLNISPNNPHPAKSELLDDAKLIIVDEFSMISLPMAAALFEALPKGCKIIFLGDPDQLPPIDTGNLASMLITDKKDTKLFKSRVHLTKNHRTDSPELSEAQTKILAGEKEYFETNPKKASNELSFSGFEHCTELNKTESILTRWIGEIETVWAKTYPSKTLKNSLLKPYDLKKTDDIKRLKACFNLLNNFRILSPVHMGIFGSQTLNKFIVHELLEKGEKQENSYLFPVGSLVLLTKNNNAIGHFNGETALVIWLNDRVTLAFPNSTASQGFDFYPIDSLSQDLQLAFAMSIHKSQGSEFEHVLIFLPPGESEMLTRPLLYTAVTRAKLGASIVSSDASLERCINTVVPNDSPCG